MITKIITKVHFALKEINSANEVGITDHNDPLQ